MTGQILLSVLKCRDISQRVSNVLARVFLMGVRVCGRGSCGGGRKCGWDSI